MISITPMSKEKMERLPFVTAELSNRRKSTLEQNRTSVLSQNIFAPKSDKEGFVTDVTYTRMGAIPLPLPFANPFLLTKTNVWAVALGLPAKEISEIADGTVIIRKSDFSKVNTKICNESFGDKGESNFYIGGEALLALLDRQLNPDTPDNIKERYKALVASTYIPNKIIPEETPVDDLLTEEPNDYHVFGPFYETEFLRSLHTKPLAFSANGLSIEDHTGISMLSSDKVLDDSDLFTEEYEYGVRNDDLAAATEEVEEEEDEGEYEEFTESSLIRIAEGIATDPEDGEDYDYEYDYPMDEDDEEGDFFDFDVHDEDELDDVRDQGDIAQINKTDSVEYHQYNPLGIYQVLMTDSGIKRLKNSILYYLPVLPVGYRKAFMGKADPKTVIYDSILTKTQELDLSMGRFSEAVDTFAAKYNAIYHLIKLLFIGDAAGMAMMRLKKGKYKSINDELKSKHGLIRSTLEGARFDYTARSVIISSPRMKMDSCGIPVEIVAAIFEPVLGPRFIKDQVSAQSSELNIDIPSYINKNYTSYLNWVKTHGAGQNLYVYLGRQPTLHYLSSQPFKVIPVEGEAIILSPIVVVPFNADFDGDQMHIEAVLTPEAHKEIKKNDLLSQQPKRTPNGDIANSPRLEMVYGLYLSVFGTAVHNEQNKSYTSESLRKHMQNLGITNIGAYTGNALCLVALQKSVISPSDTVDGKVAGHAALTYLLYKDRDGVQYDRLYKEVVKEDKKGVKLNAKAFTKIICREYSKEEIPGKITDVVLLGNGVANRFPPRLTLDAPAVLRKTIHDLVTEFNQRMYKAKDLVNLGLQSLDAYDILFNEEWDILAKSIDKAIKEMMPADNGFVLMAGTGAKGDSGVLRQLFGIKGRIKQVLDRPFNCILPECYSGSLTGLDHYCSAYGARDGLVDKVLATSKPGYLSRKLEHTGATQPIKKDDCGTKEGLEIDIIDIAEQLTDGDPNVNWHFWTNEAYEAAKSDKRYTSMYKTAKEYMSKTIMKRSVVVNGVTEYINNEADAERVINLCWGKDFPNLRKDSAPGAVKYKPVVLRSPITCKCPVCQVCYGEDPTTGDKYPVIGRQIGFIAAQAISEPGTQMTMKNFQKGGVAGSANLTSSFDVICAYFDFQGRSKTSKILYDYVSPVPAVVRERRNMDGTKTMQLYSIKNMNQALACIARGAYDEIEIDKKVEKRNIVFPGGTIFKKIVQAGESVVLGQKYLDPKQLLRSRGCASTMKYLALLITGIYQDSDVRGIHIETILSGMLLGMLFEDVTVTVDGRKVTYPAGTMISRSLLAEADGDVPEFARVTWTPIGIKQLPKYKPDATESMIMESMSSYLPKAAFLQPYDSCTNPIIRVALNQGIYKH